MREECDVKKILCELFELIMAKHMVQVEIKKKQKKMKNEKTVQKLQSKNSAIKMKLCNEKEKMKCWRKSLQ